MRRTAYASRVYCFRFWAALCANACVAWNLVRGRGSKQSTRGTRMPQRPVSRFAGDRQTVWLESRGQLRGAWCGGAEFRLVFADAASEFGAAAPFPAKDAGEFLHDFAGLELFDK